MSAGAHLADALAAEHDALAALAAGAPAQAQLVRARDAYMASHAETGPRSWGRLIGGLKMAILAGRRRRGDRPRGAGRDRATRRAVPRPRTPGRWPPW